MPKRSSGTKAMATPAFLICMGVLPTSSEAGLPSGVNRMEPSATGCRPAMASSSSRWPEPAMPAMPRISPPRAVKETLSNRFTPSPS